MKTYFYCLVPIVCASQICFSEMPRFPNFEELCEASELVIRASYISCSPEKIELDNIIYAKMVFEIDEYYKGKTEERKISVLIPIDWAKTISLHCIVFPSYQEEKEYFLFLQKRHNNVYIRVKIDDVWGERLFNPTDELIIQKEIKDQDASDRWLRREDNLTYTIPHDAKEREVSLSEYQKDRYLKIIEYQMNNEIVGERGWYKNGVLAYEFPYKNGLCHGIAKSWRNDGSLNSVHCYRKGRLHGYMLAWKNIGDLEITFWVRGNNVSKDYYIKESKINRTLPKVTVDAGFKEYAYKESFMAKWISILTILMFLMILSIWVYKKMSADEMLF